MTYLRGPSSGGKLHSASNRPTIHIPGIAHGPHDERLDRIAELHRVLPLT